MATTATSLLTAEDLLAMPDDDYRYELDRGVLRRMPPPGFRHGLVIMNTALVLGAYAKDTGSGLVSANSGFLLSHEPDRVVGPDLAFISASRLPAGEPTTGYLPFGPDLAVEVISPSDEAGEINRKIADYFAAGTRLLWHFDPIKRTVVARTPDGSVRVYADDEDLDGGDVLPGFRVPVRELFGPRFDELDQQR